jgi:methylmalonyl-CoA mutase N-terminal domain/subunit
VDLLTRIDAMGGTLAAIEAGFIQREIQDSAYVAQLAVDTGQAVVIGVNRYTDSAGESAEVFSVDPAIERQQIERVRAVRAGRSETEWTAALEQVRRAATDGRNLVPPIVTAVEAHATLGEIADTLRAVFGEYRDPSGL